VVGGVSEQVGRRPTPNSDYPPTSQQPPILWNVSMSLKATYYPNVPSAVGGLAYSIPPPKAASLSYPAAGGG
jgi:hypothetical protein